MCGGQIGRLFQNSGSIFGVKFKGVREQQQDQASAEQTEKDNAQASVKKRRASEVLSSTDGDKKSTLGG